MSFVLLSSYEKSPTRYRTIQVLARAIHRRLDSDLANVVNMSDSKFWKAQMQWFGITSVVMIATYTLANLIPFFDDFVELVGSMLSPFLAFLFPCIFYLKTMKMSSITIEKSERIVIYIIIALGLSVILFGTTASIRDLIHHTEEYGAPFDCFCESEKCYLEGIVE